MRLFKRTFMDSYTTLIISKKEMEDVMKIFKSLDKSGLLGQGISKTIKKETTEQNGELLSMFLGTLAVNLLGSPLAGKGAIGAGEGVIRTGENF